MNKILQSYALDALEDPQRERPLKASSADIQSFLHMLSSAETQEFPGTDLGTDLRFDTANLSGGGLIFEDDLVHLCVFPVEQTAGRGSSRQRSTLMRASRRGEYYH